MSQTPQNLRSAAIQAGALLYFLGMLTLSLSIQSLTHELDRPPGTRRLLGTIGTSLMLVGVPTLCFLTGRMVRKAAAQIDGT